MGCLSLPIPPIPPLPLPFTVDPPALPPISVNLELCCKLPIAIPPLPPIPLPPIVVSSPTWIAIMVALNVAIDVVTAYLDAIPLKCPRE